MQGVGKRRRGCGDELRTWRRRVSRALLAAAPHAPHRAACPPAQATKTAHPTCAVTGMCLLYLLSEHSACSTRVPFWISLTCSRVWGAEAGAVEGPDAGSCSVPGGLPPSTAASTAPFQPSPCLPTSPSRFLPPPPPHHCLEGGLVALEHGAPEGQRLGKGVEELAARLDRRHVHLHNGCGRVGQGGWGARRVRKAVRGDSEQAPRQGGAAGGAPWRFCSPGCAPSGA